MDEIREKVLGFLAEYTSPDEKDIQDFVSKIAAENPSLEIGIFKKNISKLARQAREIAAYEKELSSLDEKSPYYIELRTLLNGILEGHKNLEDISEDLKAAKRILKSAKEGKVKEKEGDEELIKQSLDAEGIEKRRGKRKEEKIVPLEGLKGLMRQLEADTTRDIIKERMTPEKHAKFEQLEEKLLSDVETGMKGLKEVLPAEKVHEAFFGKIKTFFTKEAVEVDAYNQALHGPLVAFEGMAGYDEVERYWVNEPYAFTVVLFNPEKNSYLYYVAEPKLSDFEDLFLKEIKDRLKDVLLFEDIKSDEDKEKILTNKVKKLIKDYAIDISPLTLEKILYYTRRDFIEFGKIDPLMHDNTIEDISSNGYDIPIYLYHKKYTNMPTNVYYTENELDSYVIRLAQRCGKHISIAEPMVDATMPDGSRIQMTLGTEVTTHGATFTIRKFSEVPITPVDLINWDTFSVEEMAYLWLSIENNKSLIFAGGTASGKTSSLNAVSLFIPWQAKIVSLEDTRELKLPHPNWIPGITRDSFTADGRGSIDMYDLLRAALRQRPEYLLVGEVRGKEALTLFQAMSTGHTTFSTMHADSVSSAIHRLENPPISVPRSMIQALNIMSIQAQTYVKGKRARRNMKIVEITDIDPTTRNIRTNDIFAWDALTDKIQRVGESKVVNEIMIRRGWSASDLRKELMNRQKILEFMVANKITDFNAISTIIHDYQVSPEKVLKNLMISG
jgi:flagellar protein FlaI